MVTFVRSPRERVYDALTQAEHLDAWFTTGAEIDPRSGREMRWRWVNWGPDQVTTEDWGPVVEARRSERYVFQSQAALGGTTVEVDFDEHPKGTVSRAHASTDIQTRPRAGCRVLGLLTREWGEALALLKFYVEHGVRY